MDKDEQLLRKLADAALLWNPTAVDENGVGINYAMSGIVEVPDLAQAKAYCASLKAINDSVDAFNEWLSHPFAKAVRKASYEAGHSFWMNAPLTAWMWVASDCPGLVQAPAHDH